MINFTKHKFLYLALSLAVLLPGVYSLIRYGLKLSIDFTGGVSAQYQTSADPGTVRATLASLTPQSVTREGDASVLIKLPPLTTSQIQLLRTQIKLVDAQSVELSLESLGPTLGQELIAKTITGLILATSLILLYIAFAFRDLKYGICATIATLHDTLVLLGTFSILGQWFSVEVDSLFVTALLTVLSFSVHDTIVVFDRIRDRTKRLRFEPLDETINHALSETMVRSLNNSLTIIFMLTALLLIGGQSIRYFVLALLVGTISGTYSSPFVATPLLLLWKKILGK